MIQGGRIQKEGNLLEERGCSFSIIQKNRKVNNVLSGKKLGKSYIRNFFSDQPEESVIHNSHLSCICQLFGNLRHGLKLSLELCLKFVFSLPEEILLLGLDLKDKVPLFLVVWAFKFLSTYNIYRPVPHRTSYYVIPICS